ncbi:beta-glucosidase protein [Halorhabdus tiamatea SARL4B]|uniref:Beta-glucosidase protein n=2 Tax=Halorhabdus tiamatea SARL4B TaxID=1033806 RepID=F7PIE4_9EURY|nr:glycoside hydrolase family 3 C-terminal domain-containing protein [Halorhabdus tiamatea]ERJ07087.1 beta-glucosidase protein [Halorhabdus tiamatea SARL4B]CCQ34845.1 beta-glucosidase, family GH3 [Halorhabdus tiamatea SARL4B]
MATTDTDDTTDRIEALIDRLTLEEKLDLVHGEDDPAELATGFLPGVERLDIPSVSMVDGPLGVRPGTATAFPASIALAAAWDDDLAHEQGEALGRETLGADQDVLLAPGFNIVRVPQGGRTFEYYSEDPYLASRLAVGTVEGVQDAGAIATAKHFVANNQEQDRHEVSAEVSERALREIYLPAFEAAIKEADVGSVMAAYNRINGTYATEHEWLLKDLLKDEWGFEGYVVSDWWATSDGVAAANAGLDVDMPGIPVTQWHAEESLLHDVIDGLPDALPKQSIAKLATSPWLGENVNPNLFDRSPFEVELPEAVRRGQVAESDIDEKIRRVFGQMDRFGLFDDEQPSGALGTEEHRDVATRVAERGAVLLRNEGDVLPLSPETDSIAVIGPNADTAKVGGGGSSRVTPERTVSPLEGIRERVDGDTRVAFARGTEPIDDTEGVAGMDFDLSEFAPGASGSDDGAPGVGDAVVAARQADVAVIVVQDDATEGADRSLWLPGEQDRLVAAVADAAEQTVVVCNTAGPIRMPWAGDVDAIVETWYPGQEDGHATASVLFGDTDPSGRLPVTFGRRLDDYPASSEERYPGVGLEAEYDEGVFVGYRHFDAEGIEPQFAFGHGLSYTDFTYADVTVENDGQPGATVEVDVENVGDRPGRDVVQVYLGPADAPLDRPPKALAGFETVELDAGETTTVSLDVDARAFAYYDVEEGAWVATDGDYTVLVGRSARDIVAEQTVAVEETTVVE